MTRIIFSVRCTACDHVNRPAKKIAEAIKRVLSGEFYSCRNCGENFKKIIVPNRPLVAKIKTQLPAVAERVEITSYTGAVPRAKGVV